MLAETAALPRTPVAFHRPRSAVTAVEQQRVQELDSGHVAVLGHTSRAAASVVAGAVDTLRAGGDMLSPEGRELLERQVDRCIDVIVETCRSLIRGETT